MLTRNLRMLLCPLANKPHIFDAVVKLKFQRDQTCHFSAFSNSFVLKPFCRGNDFDEDEDDLLDDVIDGGMKDAEGDDLDDRAARFLLYWTTITKVC